MGWDNQEAWRLYAGPLKIFPGFFCCTSSLEGSEKERMIISSFFFFFNNRTILLNIWTYLFCTACISFFPLPQEASALEPHVYKNTLWQQLWQGEKSAIPKVTTHNQSGEQKKAEVSGPSAAYLLSRGNNLRIETLEHCLSSTAQLSVASLFQFRLSWCCN